MKNGCRYEYRLSPFLDLNEVFRYLYLAYTLCILISKHVYIGEGMRYVSRDFVAFRGEGVVRRRVITNCKSTTKFSKIEGGVVPLPLAQDTHVVPNRK